MNTLTAIRTFAKPGFCPVKRTRIFADRYYLVTFQNVETDPRCDYVGLGDGEYTVLLPGSKAREGRDARLNHCNRIQEWTGKVYAVLTSQYGHWDTSRKPVYATSEENARAIVDANRILHDKWIRDCEKQLASYQAKYAAKPETWLESAIRNCERVIDTQRDTFKFETLRVR